MKHLQGEIAEQFNSERWDVNALINNQMGPNSIHSRVYALVLLWKGRAGDIQDRNFNRTTAEAEQYIKCADELSNALEVIFKKEMV